MIYVLYMSIFFGNPSNMNNVAGQAEKVGSYSTLAQCKNAAQIASDNGRVGNTIAAQFVCVPVKSSS